MKAESTNDPSKESEDVYDLDLEEEAEADPEALMREAVQAVDARVGSRAEAAEAGSEAADEADEGPPTSKPRAEGFPEAGSPEARIAELEAELAESREQAVRVLADYENFRRRTEKRQLEEKRYAAEGVLRECLEVVDNLERALTAEGGSDDLKQGVEMIGKQLSDVLGRAGVAPIPSVGERFDPSVHEAVARTESDEVTTATVVEEYQRGFTLHDRLLRAAKVVVAVPAPGSDGQETADE